MFEVVMHKEIRSYKEKVALGLTLRQLVCVALMLIINIPLYMFGKPYINEEILSWCIFLIAILFGGIGWSEEFLGKPLEKYAVMVIKNLFVVPRKRYFGRETLDQILLQEEIERREKELDKLMKKLSGKE